MAKTVFNNMRDMIAFIEDKNLQHEFFCLYAPHIKIDWKTLSDKPLNRADKIVAALESQQGENYIKGGEYAKIFSELRTIALVNAESENWAHLQNLMATKPAFLEFYRNFFGVSFSEKNANIAVFINLVSQGAIKEVPKNVKREAGEIWKEILARASADIQQAKISPATQFEPSELSVEERKMYIKDFEDDLRLHFLHAFPKKDFYVAVHPMPTPEYTHYVVTTSPLPHSVVAINPEKTDTVTKDDDHAQTFEIVVDEFHYRVHSSKTMLIGHVELARCFIEKMLHSAVVKRKPLNYEKALQVFRNKAVLTKFKLPKEVVKEGGKVWIDSLQVRLRDELLPVEFHGNEFTDVYGEIEKQINIAQFPYEKWCIVGATLKVYLPGTSHEGITPCFQKFGKGEKTYTVKIGEGSFSIPGTNKSFDRLHLGILEGLQDAWGVKGLNRGQKMLGTKPISLQGELNV